MKTSIFVYAGTFSPPHMGHYQIAKKFADSHNKSLWIICSENPDKTNNWFTPEECERMWLSYDLPSNVVVFTITEFKNHLDNEHRYDIESELILVRGIRSERDFEYEKTVMMYNKEQFGIEQFLYIFGDNTLSSTQIREEAEENIYPEGRVTEMVENELKRYLKQ